MARFFRPTLHLVWMTLPVLAGVALLSRARLGPGDFTGADYFVFPFLRHGHGEVPQSFFPGSWAANFLVPSYLLSVILNGLKGPATPLATGINLFWFIWVPLTAIVEVAADTLVPVFVHRLGYPFLPVAISINAAFAAALLVAHLTARNAGGEW